MQKIFHARISIFTMLGYALPLDNATITIEINWVRCLMTNGSDNTPPTQAQIDATYEAAEEVASTTPDSGASIDDHISAVRRLLDTHQEARGEPRSR